MQSKVSRGINNERDKEEERVSLRQWCRRISVRRIGFFLCILGYTWALALFGLTMNSDESAFSYVAPETVKERDVKGKTLMNSLLQEMHYMTGEINKTNQNLLVRIKQLETELEKKQSHADVDKELATKLDKQQELIERISNKLIGNDQPGQKPECEPNGDENKIYTDCREKMTHVEKNWRNNDCYKQYGVDGSKCSVRKYLSEVEPFCPLMKDREKQSFQFKVEKPKNEDRPLTNTDPTYGDLIAILTKHGPKKKYEWMKKRISDMWKGWSQAIQEFNLPKRRKKKILVHLGLLTNTPGGKFADNVASGGPLGELVQWSDIIAALYLLGHDITVISDVSDMLNYLSKTQFLYLPCKEPQNDKFYVDLIYTDIFGFKQIEERLDKKYLKFMGVFLD